MHDAMKKPRHKTPYRHPCTARAVQCLALTGTCMAPSRTGDNEAVRRHARLTACP
jgi:hypothetical protein